MNTSVTVIAGNHLPCYHRGFWRLCAMKAKAQMLQKSLAKVLITLLSSHSYQNVILSAFLSSILCIFFNKMQKDMENKSILISIYKNNLALIHYHLSKVLKKYFLDWGVNSKLITFLAVILKLLGKALGIQLLA